MTQWEFYATLNDFNLDMLRGVTIETRPGSLPESMEVCVMIEKGGGVVPIQSYSMAPRYSRKTTFEERLAMAEKKYQKWLRTYLYLRGYIWNSGH